MWVTLLAIKLINCIWFLVSVHVYYNSSYFFCPHNCANMPDESIACVMGWEMTDQTSIILIPGPLNLKSGALPTELSGSRGWHGSKCYGVGGIMMGQTRTWTQAPESQVKCSTNCIAQLSGAGTRTCLIVTCMTWWIQLEKDWLIKLWPQHCKGTSFLLMWKSFIKY